MARPIRQLVTLRNFEGATLLSAISQIILLTTANVTANRDEDLRRLSRSVGAFRKARPDVVVQHRLLLQCCSDIPQARMRFGFPPDMILTSSPKQLPLSIARNAMLDSVLATPAADLDNALIAFPDDDAWFPQGSLEYIFDRFASDPKLSFWFCRYGSDAALPEAVLEHRASLQDTISRASSNTIFLRGHVLSKIGGFDESLGLGTAAKSGEDTEFAMRAFFASNDVVHAPFKMIGHRDFDPAIRAKYFPGTLVALGRYAWLRPSSFAAFIRKILVGIALIMKQELPASEFIRAWRLFASNKSAPNSALREGRLSGVKLPFTAYQQDKRHHA